MSISRHLLPSTTLVRILSAAEGLIFTVMPGEQFLSQQDSML